MTARSWAQVSPGSASSTVTSRGNTSVVNRCQSAAGTTCLSQSSAINCRKMARRTNASSAAEVRNHWSQSASAAMRSLGAKAGSASNGLNVVGYIDSELPDGEDAVVVLDAVRAE